MTLPTAVIVGMETNGLAVSRALAAYKVPCIGLAGPQWSPSCQTKTCQVTYARSWSCEGVIADLKSIGERLDRKAPLLITKDEPVLWVSENRDQLSEFYHINLPSREVVNLLMNKTKFLELAKEEKWPVPLSWEINDRDDLSRNLSRITFPCILKPQVKNSEFREHCPQKAFKVFRQDELIRSYEMVAQWEREVIIQEWIEGKDEQIAFCLTYYDGNGEPRAIFPGRKLLQWPLECGNTVISEPVGNKQWERAIVELTKTIWQRVGFRGLGSIEYKVRKNTNEPVIMEPTVGRTNFQNELAVLNGCNIPALAYCDLVGIEPFAVDRPSRPVKLIDGSAERSAVIAAYRSGSLVVGEWLKNRSGKKKYATLRLNDMGPFVASVLLAAKNGVSELVSYVVGPTVKSKLKMVVRGLRRSPSDGKV
jgi:D-aspartate ligase